MSVGAPDVYVKYGVVGSHVDAPDRHDKYGVVDVYIWFQTVFMINFILALDKK